MYSASGLDVSIEQITAKGRKSQNEDAVGHLVPKGPALTAKGLVAMIADGVSSAEAGKEASETCVKNFLSDYFSTPDSWSVKTSSQRILTALNRWLYGQGLSYLNAERGYISTLSTLIIKSQTAHIFHIGDSRVYRLRNGDFEQLTHDHCAKVSKDSTYLTRAMGMDLMLDVDYYADQVMEGDIFFLSTDGIHDFMPRAKLKSLLESRQHDLAHCCEAILEEAFANGSDDNLSCLLMRVNGLPDPSADDAYVKLSELPFPPPLSKGMKIDNFEVLDEVHASNRSQVYRVKHRESQKTYVMKTPSINYEDDLAYIERFVMEPWIGQRIDSEHVVKVYNEEVQQKFLYYVCENAEGLTLKRWMEANPKPGVDRVVRIVEQIVKGARAMHRKETLHQDIKPENIMIDAHDHVTLIDFGSCNVAGVAEIDPGFQRDVVLGTETYGAPEYKLGRKSTLKSDLFSIAVVMYEMLTAKHPYGAEDFEQSQSTNEFYRLSYHPARDYNPMVPVWMDGALKKAMQVSPDLRYEALSEFVYDLQHPNPQFMDKSHVPLTKRNPLRFWQCLCAGLAVFQLVTLWAWLG